MIINNFGTPATCQVDGTIDLKVPVIASVLLAIIATGAWSDDAVFRQSAGRPSEATRLIRVVHGNEANQSRDYPASFSGEFDRPCSATRIGRDALITAAHCVLWSPSVKLEYNSKQVDIACTPDKRYDPYTAAYDVALCKILEHLDGDRFDVIAALDDERVKEGAKVRLTGWADPPPASPITKWWHRLKRRLGFGSPFKVGLSTIVKTGSVLYVTGDEMNGGYVVIESGDSGGAAYIGQAPERVIVGINSCGGDGCLGGGEHSTLLANLTDRETGSFIREWAKDYAQVCGFNSEDGCRFSRETRLSKNGGDR